MDSRFGLSRPLSCLLHASLSAAARRCPVRWCASSTRQTRGSRAAAMSGGGMDLEVRVVGGARTCFAALPLHLIQALERTSASGELPPVLALDLRAAGGSRWSLAWSGAASQSRAIEVAQELAECISLPDGTIAQLSVARSLGKAVSDSIEPFSEDD